MDSQHTPAPWTPNHNSWLVGPPPGNHCVVNVGASTRADARLIQAAPELLAVLKEAALHGRFPREVRAQIVAVLDKAEGRS